MARIVKDRVKDTSTTTGTGTITLANSPPNGFQAFSVLGDGSTTFYCIEDANGTAFEVGVGTYTGNTLARTTILESSNSDNAISLTSGTHTAFVTYPSNRSTFNDEGLSPTFTASGTITAGKPVIQNTNGTVTQVFETTSVDTSPTVKQITDMNGSDTSTDHVATAYEASSERFVMFYRDTSNSNYPTIVAGSWSSGTVTWGTPHVVENTGLDNEPSLTAGDGYVIASYDDGGACKLRVFSISGTSFTQTAAANISDNPSGNKVAYVPSSAFSGSPYSPVCGVIAHVYSIVPGGGSATTYVQSHTLNISNGTIAGSTSEESFMSTNAHMDRADIVADPDNGKAIYATFDGSDGDVGKAFVIGFGGTASSPTDTVGTGVDFSGSDDADYVSACYDTQNNKVFITWKNDDGSNPLWKGTIGTINAGSNSISYTGTATIWDGAGGMSQADVEMDTVNNKIMFFYRDDDNSDRLTYKTITPGASSFSVATGGTMSNGDIFLHSGSASFGANKGFLVGLNDRSDSNKVAYSTAFFATVTTSNLNSTNFFGIASNSATTTNPVQINVHGSINNAQTSLTVDKDYYTTSAGNIVTRLNGSGVAQATQFVGTALSATALELKTFPANTIVGKADGTVTKGKAVIVEADGDFAQAGQANVTNTGTASQGSLGNMGTYVTDLFAMAVAKDGLTYCFTYQNGSTQQACKIGTRSGETISWGSELVLASANSSSHFVSYDDEANVFLTTYTTGDTVKGTAVSFSGNTGTKGTEVTIMDLGGASSAPYQHYQHWYDSTNEVTVCWAKGGVSGNDTNRSSAVVLTLTGTSISVGTLYENTTAGGQYSKGCDITGGKHVLYWRSSSNNYPYVMTMTVTSSGAISWGTPLVINSAAGSWSNPVYNPTYPNKAILAGKISTANNYYSYAGLTISGTSITASNFSDGNINNAQSYVESGGNVAVYSNYSGNYCFVYQTYSPYNSRYNFATTTDGLSLTVATAVTTTAHGSNQFYAGACASDVDGVVVENHNDRSSNPGYYSYYCFNPTFNYTSLGPTNLTAENYIGIAQETVSTGNDVKVTTISGVDANQSSLTPAQLYYVQSDGTLSTTAGSPSVVAGLATSATTVLVTRS